MKKFTIIRKVSIEMGEEITNQDPFLTRIEDYLTQKNISSLGTTIITKVNGKSKLSSAIVLADNYIFLIIQQKHNKIKECKIYLYSITSLELNSDHFIFIRYDKKRKIYFQTSSPQELIDSIINHIHQYFTPKEFSNLSYPRASNADNCSPPTSHSIFRRVRDHFLVKKVPISNNPLRSLYNKLICHQNSLSIIKFSSSEFFYPIIFEALSMTPYITELDVRYPALTLPIMNKYIDCFDYISHLKIKGEDSKDIQLFYHNAKIANSITFYEHNKVTYLYVDVLMERKKINSVGFESKLTRTDFNNFIRLPSFQNLSYFRITKFTDFDFRSSAKYFYSLRELSMRSCNVLIGDILEIISDIRLKSLRKLDLSGNIGNGFISNQSKKEFKLIETLETLYVDDVEWDCEQLILFMEIVKTSSLEYLSMRNIKFITEQSAQTQQSATNNAEEVEPVAPKTKKKQSSDDEEFSDHHHRHQEVDFTNIYNESEIDQKWSSFFDHLPSHLNVLNSLNWDFNRIDDKFVTFLKNCPKLSFVSFCHCKSDYLGLIETILTQQNINSINLKSIRFDETKSHLNELKHLLSHIQKMKQLKQIDLTNSSLDDDCFTILEEALVKSNIEAIALDDSNVSSQEAYIKLIHKLTSKKEAIRISYPVIDFERFEMNKNEVQALINHFGNLEKPFESRSIAQPIYLSETTFLNLDREFPLFMSRADIKEMEENDQIEKVYASNDDPIEGSTKKQSKDEENQEVKPQKPKRTQSQIKPKPAFSPRNRINSTTNIRRQSPKHDSSSSDDETTKKRREKKAKTPQGIKSVNSYVGFTVTNEFSENSDEKSPKKSSLYKSQTRASPKPKPTSCLLHSTSNRSVPLKLSSSSSDSENDQNEVLNSKEKMWDQPFPSIPPVDNSDILEDLYNRFNFNYLVSKLPKTKY